MSFSSDDLVAAVRREALIPDASDITAADILAIADDEMLSTLAEISKSSQQAFAMTSEDVALSAAVLRYRYPRRALGRTIRGVTWLDAQGLEHPLVEMDAVEGQFFGETGNYFVEADEIVFYRAIPEGAVTLRWRYMRRASKLVPVASCAGIVSATDTLHLVCSTAPLAADGSYVDIVRGDAPYDLMNLDLRLKALSVLTYELNGFTPVVVADFVNRATIPNARQDYICARDQTCYPPIPNEGWPLLVSRVARVVLESTRDAAGAAMADATSARRDAALRAIIQPRNESGNRTTVNHRSPLRSGGGGAGRGRRWWGS